MKQKSPISLLLSFTLVVCGGSTTEQDTQTQPQQTQEDTQTQPQQTQGQGPQNNNNPFLDPNYSDCLKDKFGEERYKELQNQQPTPEEEDHKDKDHKDKDHKDKDHKDKDHKVEESLLKKKFKKLLALFKMQPKKS